MTHSLSAETWAQIRYDYEHTDRLIEDICDQHGISARTLNDRVRRWGWRPRRSAIPREGPPPVAPPPVTMMPLPAPPVPEPADLAPEHAAEPSAAVPPKAVADEAAASVVPPSPSPGERAFTPAFDGLCEAGLAGGDDTTLVTRLQGAVSRVLSAIEATIARLELDFAHPRRMEQAGRALSSLTRTLRELTGLLAQCQAAANNQRRDEDDEGPEDIDEFRRELARRMDAFVEAKEAEAAAESADAGGAGV